MDVSLPSTKYVEPVLLFQLINDFCSSYALEFNSEVSLGFCINTGRSCRFPFFLSTPKTGDLEGTFTLSEDT